MQQGPEPGDDIGERADLFLERPVDQFNGARIQARPIDLSRPPWEMWVIEGADDSLDLGHLRLDPSSLAITGKKLIIG